LALTLDDAIKYEIALLNAIGFAFESLNDDLA